MPLHRTRINTTDPVNRKVPVPRRGAWQAPRQHEGERMGGLTRDPDFLGTVWVVQDVEATTPAGHPPQPIEVVALALRYEAGRWTEVGRRTSLIRPPAFAPVTAATTTLNGLPPEQLAAAPTPAQALG